MGGGVARLARRWNRTDVALLAGLTAMPLVIGTGLICDRADPPTAAAWTLRGTIAAPGALPPSRERV